MAHLVSRLFLPKVSDRALPSDLAFECTGDALVLVMIMKFPPQRQVLWMVSALEALQQHRWAV